MEVHARARRRTVQCAHMHALLHALSPPKSLPDGRHGHGHKLARGQWSDVRVVQVVAVLRAEHRASLVQAVPPGGRAPEAMCAALALLALAQAGVALRGEAVVGVRQERRVAMDVAVRVGARGGRERAGLGRRGRRGGAVRKGRGRARRVEHAQAPERQLGHGHRRAAQVVKPGQPGQPGARGGRGGGAARATVPRPVPRVLALAAAGAAAAGAAACVAQPCLGP